MVTNTWVDLKIPEARRLADLTGVHADLFRARHYAEQILTEYSSEKPNWNIVEPLSISLAVAYCRAFLTGVRDRLGEADLGILSADERSFHEWLLSYRSKHVAHSVNAFEENQPQARYCVERVEEEGITSITCTHARMSGLSGSDCEEALDLIAKLIGHVGALIDAERKTILEKVRAMPLREILAGDRNMFYVGHETEINKRRK